MTPRICRIGLTTAGEEDRAGIVTLISGALLGDIGEGLRFAFSSPRLESVRLSSTSIHGRNTTSRSSACTVPTSKIAISTSATRSEFARGPRTNSSGSIKKISGGGARPRPPKISPRIEQEYETRVRAVVDKCRQGTPLDATDVEKLRDSVIALQRKVPEVVPARDSQRSNAMKYVQQLDDATRIFAEQTYAERLIRDVTEHEARSIAELLGFMRYHRLMFDESGKSPEALQRYEGLYQLLREQKEKLGIQKVPPGGLAAVAPKMPPSAAGNWLHFNREPMVLKPDGTIIKGRGRGQWKHEDQVLILRWPAPNAPGGARVDRVTLSEDGKKYEGKNQRGARIFGQRTVL
jgi:hypothetical protein